MPRSSRGSAPRPRASAPAPARPAQQQQQQRPMTTTAAQRPGQQQNPAQQGKQSSGLFGQMASTAAGVAVGSSIGHAIGGFFGGGSSAAPAEQEQYQQPVDNYSQQGQAMDSGYYNTSAQSQSQPQGPCANDIKSFTQCMEQNRGDMNICGWYIQQLQACQQAARQYGQ